MISVFLNTIRCIILKEIFLYEVRGGRMKLAQKVIKEYFNGWLDVSIELSKSELKYFPDRPTDCLRMFESAKEAVNFALNKLDPTMLKAITMHEKDNIPWQQISDALGIKKYRLVTYKSRLIADVQKGLED